MTARLECHGPENDFGTLISSRTADAFTALSPTRRCATIALAKVENGADSSGDSQGQADEQAGAAAISRATSSGVAVLAFTTFRTVIRWGSLRILPDRGKYEAGCEEGAKNDCCDEHERCCAVLR